MPGPYSSFSRPLGFDVRGVAASGWRRADLRTRGLVILLAILAIPVLILLIVIALALALVMSILAAASALIRRFTGPRPVNDDAGRENVRVIRRDLN